ncbi:MAG: MFS transporter [Myxococcaceae bacterium]|nr:MFS transporter [Myxococcaceae bacterium]
MKFTRYQYFVIALLVFVQFTVVLDFMILSPLGALLMPTLKITPAQFGTVVSAYAFSAGAAGILAAGFADKFDRKRLLLFFYAGFVVGTVLCGLATDYTFLLLARIVTGLFGGVMGSISMAIVADLFPFEARGRVMGLTMTAFAGAQVLGLPIGLYVSNHWGWHAPFMLIAGIAALVGVVAVVKLQPIDEHLKKQSQQNAFAHLFKTVTLTRYQWAFAATGLLATGGFMLMPFGSAFTVHNLGIPLDQIPAVYMVSGAASIVAGPVLGRISDRFGKLRTFMLGSFITTSIVLYYTRLGHTPLWLVMTLNAVMFVGIGARMISAQALSSAIPAPSDRGAFMAINSSLQQIAGGIASWVAGLIVIERPDGSLARYEWLGYVVATSVAITIVLMSRLNRMVAAQPPPAQVPAPQPALESR